MQMFRSRACPLPLLVAFAGALALAGCATEADPVVARESLSEVTEAPAAPQAAELYDAELHPEPIVEPRECTRYLVVTARGTGEKPDDQLLTPVARTISEARPDEVDVLDLDYPADTEVNEGGTLAVRTLIDTLDVQSEACPEQTFVLLGYSQGALVVGDALAEPDTRLIGATVGTLSEAASERVRAIVLYGNPRFVGGESSDAVGHDSGATGLMPRPRGGLDAYADRMRDYCATGDFVCRASLDLDESGHVAYYRNGMLQDGAAFAITLLDPVSDAAVERSPSGSDAADATGEGDDS